MSRFAKQLLFGGIYLTIFVGIAWFAYRIVVPAPTCTDAIQNGGEEGIDCGALACGTSCAVSVILLENLPVQIIHYGNGSYDVVAHLENKNVAYGASRVSYTLVVSDAAGTKIATRKGTTYVNPLEPRYLVFPLIDITGTPVKAELQFAPIDVQWAALDVAGGLGVSFAVTRDELTVASGSVRFGANVTNQSAFDFDQVDATVLLLGDGGAVIGAGATVINTLNAGEARGFVIDWPFAIPLAVRTRAIVTTNLFNNDNYLRAHGSQEPFQGY